MSEEKIAIASAASVLIGGSPITSFEAEGAESVSASSLYEMTVKRALALHRWRFAARQQQLSRDAAAPAGGWDAAYQIPADAQNIYRVTVGGCEIRYDRIGDKLVMDTTATDEVVATYSVRPHESDWPDYFRSLVELMLASRFAYSIAHNAGLGRELAQEARLEMRIARTLDSQGRTPPGFQTDRFIRNRGRLMDEPLPGKVEYD